jgi:hypothetical protein
VATGELTFEVPVQVGLMYQLAFNGERFARVVEARTLVHHVIGQWLIDHNLSHSASVQPLYTFHPAHAAHAAPAAC